MALSDPRDQSGGLEKKAETGEGRSNPLGSSCFTEYFSGFKKDRRFLTQQLRREWSWTASSSTESSRGCACSKVARVHSHPKGQGSFHALFIMVLILTGSCLGWQLSLTFIHSYN